MWDIYYNQGYFVSQLVSYLGNYFWYKVRGIVDFNREKYTSKRLTALFYQFVTFMSNRLNDTKARCRALRGKWTINLRSMNIIEFIPLVQT